DLCRGPRGLSTPEFELEEPVAGDVEPLGEEQVVLVAGVDVGDAPAVPEDFDRLVETGHAPFLRPTAGVRDRGQKAECQEQAEGRPGSVSHEGVRSVVRPLCPTRPRCAGATHDSGTGGPRTQAGAPGRRVVEPAAQSTSIVPGGPTMRQATPL